MSRTPTLTLATKEEWMSVQERFTWQLMFSLRDLWDLWKRWSAYKYSLIYLNSVPQNDTFPAPRSALTCGKFNQLDLSCKDVPWSISGPISCLQSSEIAHLYAQDFKSSPSNSAMTDLEEQIRDTGVSRFHSSSWATDKKNLIYFFEVKGSNQL